ncbi:MAG: hypothetical protein KOO63_02180 [Bacteroidales bacterium]|nr:hypothetical protein [Candidatus Latescibacterota bacterium]
MKRDAELSESSEQIDHRHTRAGLFHRFSLIFRHPMILTFCAALIVVTIGCSKPKETVSEKSSTLSPDERYIVQLYMKINDLEKNLQENPSDSTKKWAELRKEVDEERIRAILVELEKDPERWLAVFGRISELVDRKQ